jgi:dienelactone hydrolase
MTRHQTVLTVVWLVGMPLCALAEEVSEGGFQVEVAVTRPTRLDWQFVAAEFGKDAARLPHFYLSARQRYQLYVPPAYRPDETWPLLLFLSPGDDPLGWRFWQKLCEDKGVFFCAAYGAGNNTPPGQRIRLILDVLDDVRRRFPIDPDRTYLAGFSGGGRLACTIAFAMPEYFGGVLAVCGANPPHHLDYLRHRAEDRLSVALVTGETDFDRRESEVLWAPLFGETGVRSRLWVIPRAGHEMPPEAVLSAVHTWLEEDLPRRRREAKDRLGPKTSPDELLTDHDRAERLLESARAEMYRPDRLYRGTAMLVGLLARWSDTDAGDKARVLLKELRDDPVRRQRLAEQSDAEERRLLGAQAKALENFGRFREARDSWQRLAKSQADRPAGARAAAEVKRLDALLATSPFLGVHFEGQTTIVKAVVRRGPADRAGVQAGDRILKLGDAATPSIAEARHVLQTLKPGDKLAIEVQRDGKKATLTIEVGALRTGE